MSLIVSDLILVIGTIRMRSSSRTALNGEDVQQEGKDKDWLQLMMKEMSE